MIILKQIAEDNLTSYDEKEKFIENKAFAKNLLICIGTMVFSAQLLAYVYISSSPFIYLGWGSIILFLVSFLNYRKLS